MGRIFISYSSKDAKLASEMVMYLESHGVECWMAPRNIASGHDYTDSIDDAIKQCVGIVLIYSDHSARSVWVKKEIALGISYQKNIIPFKITKAAVDGGMNFMLNNLQWIETKGNPSWQFGEVLEGLRKYDKSIAPTEGNTADIKKSPNKGKPYWVAGCIAAAVVIGAVAAFILPKTGSGDVVTADSMVVADTTSVEGKVEEEVQMVETKATSKKDNAPDTKKESSKTRKESNSKVEEAVGNKVDAKENKSSTTRIGQEQQPQEEHQQSQQQQDTQQQQVSQGQQEAQTDRATEASSEVKQTTTTKTKTTTTRPKTDSRYTKAKQLYNAKRYKDALTLFEKLKAEGSTEQELDVYIRLCKEKIP